MAELERHGAAVGRAVWQGRWTAPEFRDAYNRLAADRRRIDHVTFAGGTVAPPGLSLARASGHLTTWRIAYWIEPIRARIFGQH